MDKIAVLIPCYNESRTIRKRFAPAFSLGIHVVFFDCGLIGYRYFANGILSCIFNISTIVSTSSCRLFRSRLMLWSLYFTVKSSPSNFSDMCACINLRIFKASSTLSNRLFIDDN